MAGIIDICTKNELCYIHQYHAEKYTAHTSRGRPVGEMAKAASDTGDMTYRKPAAYSRNGQYDIEK